MLRQPAARSARPRLPDGAFHISGAGPAGLAAAITIAKSGGRAVVHEQRRSVGSRFHNDYQGLENWTSKGDVIEELAAIGIEPSFPHTPFRELHIFDPQGVERRYHSLQPLFYLLLRGPAADTLDAALLAQASSLGVELRFREKVRQLSRGGIVADGPRQSDVIAAGFVFDTEAADGAYAAFGEHLAPGGYAYLLIHKGRGTLASCLFHDFHNEAVYVERSVQFFQNKLGFNMHNEKRFGGAGNYRYPGTAVKGNILYAGEAAGFQDALWGFGMRHAFLSGYLAAKAVLAGDPAAYDRLWQQRLGGVLRTGFVNRWRFNRFTDADYSALLAQAANAADTRRWLHGQCRPSLLKSVLFHLGRRRIAAIRTPRVCFKEGCRCTWCRCQPEYCACDAGEAGA